MPTYEPRLCELPTCRTQFTPRRAYQRYCCHDHSKKAWDLLSDEERAERRANRSKRHPKAKYIHEAMADTEPGMCPWGCEKPLTGMQRACCGEKECRAAYHRAYRAGRTEVGRGGPLPARLCECGCGTSFVPRDSRQKHVDAQHGREHRNRVYREERHANPKPIGRPKKTRGMAIRFGKGTESPVIRPYYR